MMFYSGDGSGSARAELCGRAWRAAGQLGVLPVRQLWEGDRCTRGILYSWTDAGTLSLEDRRDLIDTRKWEPLAQGCRTPVRNALPYSTKLGLYANTPLPIKVTFDRTGRVIEQDVPRLSTRAPARP